MLAADLLEALLRERTFAQDVMLHDGVGVLLSLLHSEDSCARTLAPAAAAARLPPPHTRGRRLLRLQWGRAACNLLSNRRVFATVDHLAPRRQVRSAAQPCGRPSRRADLPLPLMRSLEVLAPYPECAKDIVQLGGINLLLHVLSAHESSGPRGTAGQAGATNAAAAAASSAAAPPTVPSSPPLLIAASSALTALALDGEAALQIRKANGIFLLGQLLLCDFDAHAVAALNDAMSDPTPPSIFGGQDSGREVPFTLAPADSTSISSAISSFTSFPAKLSADRGADSGGGSEGLLVAAHVFRALRFLFSTGGRHETAHVRPARRNAPAPAHHTAM